MNDERHPAAAATVWLVPGDPSRHLADLLAPGADGTGVDADAVALTDLPDRPFDLRDRRLVVAVDLATDDDGAAVVLAAARGVDVVLLVAAHPRRTALLDELSRVAEIHDLTCPSPDPITPEQAALLGALAEGDSVAVAARRVGLSRRTAYRRLEEVGSALGTSTVRATVEAARAAGLLPDGITDRRRR